MKRNIFKLTLVSILSFNLFANLHLKDTSIRFVATGNPAFIKAKGEAPLVSKNLIIKMNLINGEAIADISKLDSGIELRDQHLKEDYLNTAKYPKATLTLKDQEVLPLKSSRKLKAILNLHGVDKEVVLDASFERKGAKLFVTASFEILLSDYGIELPSFQGITAANKVNLYINTILVI